MKAPRPSKRRELHNQGRRVGHSPEDGMLSYTAERRNRFTGSKQLTAWSHTHTHTHTQRRLFRVPERGLINKVPKAVQQSDVTQRRNYWAQYVITCRNGSAWNNCTFGEAARNSGNSSRLCDSASRRLTCKCKGVGECIGRHANYSQHGGETTNTNPFNWLMLIKSSTYSALQNLQ
jgi:hypothetical protein